MGYLLLGGLLGASLLVATAVVVRRAERGDHRWGFARARVALPAAGAYRTSVVVRWRRLRAPRVALGAAGSALVLAIVGVPAALVATLFSVVAAAFDVATLTNAIMACAAPVALFRVLFGARTALGLLDAELASVSRARAEVRWERAFDALLGAAMLLAIIVTGHVDPLAVAGIAWAAVGLAQSALVGRATRSVAARLERVRIPPADATAPGPAAA